MFITKKHIPRRTFLRGAGVTLALPLLDAMVPAATLLAQTAANSDAALRRDLRPARHGARLLGARQTEGTGFEFPFIFKPLEPYREQRDDSERPPLPGRRSRRRAEPAPTIGWRRRSCARTNRRRTAGADVYNGTTIDQIIAQKIGQDNLMPSMQLAVEDPGANSSNCGEGYSCAYTNSISWSTPTTPLPMELNPQVVFERMFGDGSTAEERAARREQDRSILDSLTGSLARLRTDISAGRSQPARRVCRGRARDRAAAADCHESLDRRAGRDRPCRSACRNRSTNTSSCSSTCWRWPSAATSPASARCCMRATSRPGAIPESGADRGLPRRVAPRGRSASASLEYSKMNQYHVTMLAHFVEKLAKTPDGDGTLLDHSLVLYGTNMGNSNQHRPLRCAARARRRGERTAQGRTSPGVSDARRCRRAICCSACWTCSTFTRTASATARGGWRNSEAVMRSDETDRWMADDAYAPWWARVAWLILSASLGAAAAQRRGRRGHARETRRPCARCWRRRRT